MYEFVVQIPPLRILALDHFEFPDTMPLLDALFTKDRIHHGLVKLHKDYLVHAVIPNKSGNCIRSVLPNTARKIARDADI